MRVAAAARSRRPSLGEWSFRERDPSRARGAPFTTVNSSCSLFDTSTPGSCRFTSSDDMIRVANSWFAELRALSSELASHTVALTRCPPVKSDIPRDTRPPRSPLARARSASDAEDASGVFPRASRARVFVDRRRAPRLRAPRVYAHRDVPQAPRPFASGQGSDKHVYVVQYEGTTPSSARSKFWLFLYFLSYFRTRTCTL